ncbi:hypothetical protein P3T73_04150 [Kiritimatiellota bacterium B12222]|nr:hypothetical protein P3T73_04150 [Kiritimatiellota bacterium B12222]
MSNHGNVFEDDVEKLLNHTYLGDFIARGPEIQFGQGKPEELADAVLVLGETIIAFQCKSRAVPSPEMLDETEQNRIRNKMQEGVKQLKTIRRALNQELDLNLVNAHGIPMRSLFPADTPLIGIVLINLHGLAPDVQERINIVLGADYQHEMPIHLLKAQDFWFATEFIDTVPDLIKFLEHRFTLHLNGQIHAETSEQDFIMFYKSRYDAIEEHLVDPSSGIQIEAGFARKFIEEHDRELAERTENLKTSYLVDEIIDFFKVSIGYNPADDLDPDSEEAAELMERGRGTEEAYFMAINELGMLSRLERKNFGESLVEKSILAEDRGHGYRIYTPDEPGRTPFFMFCYKGNRVDRLRYFEMYLCMACVQLNLPRVVGISTESSSAPEGRSYDIAVKLLEDIPPENRAIFSECKIFADPRRSTTDEWKG